MEPLEATMQGLVQNWYNVASLSDDSQKTKDILYKETERVVSLLTNEIREKALSKDKIRELCVPLRLEFRNKRGEQSGQLAKWIARNTRYDGAEKFEGAYSIFRKLLTVVESGYEDRTALPQSGMAFIDSESLRIIEANRRYIFLPMEVEEGLIYSRLSLGDLKAMRTNKASRITAKNVLIRKNNSGEIEIGCAAFPSLKAVVDFLGPRCSDITILRSFNYPIKQSDFNLLKHFPDITAENVLINKFNMGEIEIGCAAFPSLKAVVDFLGPRCSEITTLRTCNYQIKQSDFNLLGDFPNLTILKGFSCFYITDFCVLLLCKKLVEVDLKDFVYMEGLRFLQHCENLADLSLESCTRLGDLTSLWHCKKLTRLRLTNCLDLTELRSLQHLNLTNLCLMNCSKLTDISPLLDSLSLRSSLRYLHLSNCCAVVLSFRSLCDHFPNIVELVFNECVKKIDR